MALFGKKGWHRMTYIEAWAGGPNAVALDTVYGGFINVSRANHAIRLLDRNPWCSEANKGLSRTYLVSTYAAVLELAQTLRGGAAEAVPCQDILGV